MQATLNYFTCSEIETSNVHVSYSEILKLYELKFDTGEFYFQIGEIPSKGQWVLHISVVKKQLIRLLLDLLHFLTDENVPFRFVRNEVIAGQFLDGTLGFQHLGKLICIFPENEARALLLAEKLILLTGHYKGPAIPTDRCLGGCVYAEYVNNPSAFNFQPTEPNTNYRIHFKMPKGISWPFYKIAKPGIVNPRRFLKGKYLPVLIVKSDCKGFVYKAVNFKKVFHPDWCIIKEGKNNMCSDDHGRDIGDRLEWQWFLHNELAYKVSIPKPIEIFEYRGNSFLVMEFIEGICLNNWLGELYQDRQWNDLSITEQILICDYLLAILDIVQHLHDHGYIHRDLSPENFIIAKTGRLVLIDLELTYSINMYRPSPPFKWGTPGFMSPQQIKVCNPTIAEDIFGIGALIITLFTGVSPDKIETNNWELLFKQLSLCNVNQQIFDLITDCLEENPINRPELRDIRQVIMAYKQRMSGRYAHEISS